MGTIKLKRGNNANLTTLTLEAGEPAFVLDTGKLYVGDGTNKVLINPDQPNAETATKLQNARTIALTGDVTGSVAFDGSANVSITTTVADDSHNHVISNVDGLQTSLDGKAASSHTHTLSNITDAGTAASKNVGTASGNVPVLDANGKIDQGILPAIAITDTFVVNAQAAMLALTAEVGDVAVRTDLNKTFILKTSPASTLANWQEMLTPTNAVTSVAGKTGAVTLTSSDVGLGNVTNESKATMLTNAALTGTPTAPTAAVATNTTQIATTAFVKSQGYAPLASPTFTGTAAAPTPTSTDNSTKIATTAFVKAQGYLDGNSVIDGGTF